MNRSQEENGRGFPTIAGIFLGLGHGGFFDGIILHQVLQRHHISTYVFTATGMAILWRKALQPHAPRSGKMLVGAMLMGFGIFNLVEGITDHHLLGIHHVNETVPPEQWIFWDGGFLIWGALMLVGGWLLWRAGKHETAMTSERSI